LFNIEVLIVPFCAMANEKVKRNKREYIALVFMKSKVKNYILLYKEKLERK